MSLSSSWQRNRGGRGRNHGESGRSPETQLKAFAKVNSGDICIQLHVIVSVQTCVCGALNWFGSGSFYVICGCCCRSKELAAGKTCSGMSPDLVIGKFSRLSGQDDTSCFFFQS